MNTPTLGKRPTLITKNVREINKSSAGRHSLNLGYNVISSVVVYVVLQYICPYFSYWHNSDGYSCMTTIYQGLTIPLSGEYYLCIELYQEHNIFMLNGCISKRRFTNLHLNSLTCSTCGKNSHLFWLYIYKLM